MVYLDMLHLLPIVLDMEHEMASLRGQRVAYSLISRLFLKAALRYHQKPMPDSPLPAAQPQPFSWNIRREPMQINKNFFCEPQCDPNLIELICEDKAFFYLFIYYYYFFFGGWSVRIRYSKQHFNHGIIKIGYNKHVCNQNKSTWS